MERSHQYDKEWQDRVDSVLTQDYDNTMYLQSYYRHIKKKKTLSTIYNYLNHIVKFYTFVDKQANELNIQDYEAYLSTFEDKSASYQIAIHAALKSYAKFLYDSDIAQKNYMKNVDAAVSSGEEKQALWEKRESEVLDDEDIVNLFEAIQKDKISDEMKLRNRVIVSMFLTTGIRASALGYIMMQDVDLAQGKVMIHEKGKKDAVNKRRILNLGPELTELLSEWVETRNNYIIEHDFIDNDYLFVTWYKSKPEYFPTTTAQIRYMVKQYGKKIGKNLHPHVFRHTFATKLYEKEKDITVVKESLNHSSLATTMVYINRSEEKATRGVQIMSDEIFGLIN